MPKEIFLGYSDFLLISANHSHLDVLRNAKNSNKKSFFLKEDITEQQQLQWFENYLLRKGDFMFLTIHKESYQIFGCMGFRLMDDVIDGYNIIRIKHIPNTSMKDAFLELIILAKSFYPGKIFQVRVLKDNPAIKWYESLGFKTVSEETNFVTMYYNEQ